MKTNVFEAFPWKIIDLELFGKKIYSSGRLEKEFEEECNASHVPASEDDARQ